MPASLAGRHLANPREPRMMRAVGSQRLAALRADERVASDLHAAETVRAEGCAPERDTGREQSILPYPHD